MKTYLYCLVIVMSAVGRGVSQNQDMFFENDRMNKTVLEGCNLSDQVSMQELNLEGETLYSGKSYAFLDNQNTDKTHTIAIYTSEESGTYTLHVWSDAPESSLSIVVIPPFWNVVLLWSVLAFFFAVFILILVKKRKARRDTARQRFVANHRYTEEEEKFVEEVQRIVNENLSNDAFSIEMLSKQVGVSRTQLNRKLHELMDTTPSELVRSFRVHTAAQLIRESGMRMTEIYLQVGFSGRAPFIDNFKKYYQMTPSDYARKYRQRRKRGKNMEDES
ncbi:AraC family transcriptional regulator [Reichenbachiella carrageenanivorans]|uniref:AraC family transcriptional regulator n=1 Tax=Reichenbachiella carrageenanivorans TaxID=2979869 RepID=A0ABY6D1X0_9BACT|nr:AraC family transcriptional regulator [Reichenbachiella carrageenanivorans]UXX79063.1 AraC family transcriptional regulator [Reichenbachiella carrageenanivorans]